ncbi:MAG: hypothetical protein HYU78_00510 [Rhodocyclales bacterium]|nr:hypothetical protein [Rhodocyclales bacterium]
MNFALSEQRALVKARAAEVFAALGAEDTSKHQRCIFPDHADQDPSFRTYGERFICTCSHGDVIDAVSRVTGLNHAQAVHWAAERISGGFSPVAARPNVIPAPLPRNGYAAQLWISADREDAYVQQHAYCQRKGIAHAFGAGRTLVSGSVVGEQADCVVVPIRENGAGNVIAVQAISDAGAKQTFGTLGDGYLLVGDERDLSAPWLVVEGWATAHAARQAERCSIVLISFGKGRLQKVAQLAADRYQPAAISILAEV